MSVEEAVANVATRSNPDLEDVAASHSARPESARRTTAFTARSRSSKSTRSSDVTKRDDGEMLPVVDAAKRITQDGTAIGAVVLKHQKGMKESWCIATNRADLGAAEIVQRYARRFTIEETFRDIKDNHFGMGLSATNIRSADRRDRLLFISAIAQALLTQLGAAGEACGLDRILKTNTVKTRTMSLFNQGSYWYRAIPNMREERLRPLMEAFGKIVSDHAAFKGICGVI